MVFLSPKHLNQIQNFALEVNPSATRLAFTFESWAFAFAAVVALAFAVAWVFTVASEFTAELAFLVA